MATDPDSSASGPEAWRERQRRAAGRLDATVSGLLAELGGAVGGAGRGRAWEIAAEPEAATWRLYRVVSEDPGAGWRYQQLGVRATIAPSGKLVGWQVDDGEEFLALVDIGPAGLRRGLVHLLTKGLPVRESTNRPFAGDGGRGFFGRLWRLLGRRR